ncbi:MAG: hypothetical protein WCT44_03690 [Candidatus Paceibacterota bacterium]
MKKKNLIRFAQSLVILPVMAMSTPISNIPKIELPQNVLVQKLNNTANGLLALNQAPDPAVKILKAKAEAIDAYFRERDMPLVGTGLKMAEEAEKNGLDWRLLAAIAVRESTGGKFECKKVPNNPFGWGSCKIGFKSDDHAIETVARNLGGNNPNTAYHYDDKTTVQILRAYNPPSIVPRYAEQVINIMNDIGELEANKDSISNT